MLCIPTIKSLHRFFNHVGFFGPCVFDGFTIFCITTNFVVMKRIFIQVHLFRSVNVFCGGFYPSYVKMHS